MKVEILEENQLFKGFFNLYQTKLQFEQFNGQMSEPVYRLNVYRGDAVAILAFHSKMHKVALVRQFRYPVYTVEPENAWTLEVVAGSVEGNADIAQTAVRELEEEIGYRVAANDLQYIGKCYPSPGGTSERIYLYAVDLANAQQIHKGGGNAHEAEDIEVVTIDYEQVCAMIDSGKICDAKSLILFNWFRCPGGGG